MGIYCQKWYVHESEDNYGLVQQCQQLMESYVQMIKRELRVRGNSLAGWARRVFNFSDLYCVGAMAYDEINFYNILKKSESSMNLIYDEYATRLIEEKMEYEMPDLFWELLQLVEPIEPGGEIPRRIVQIMNGMDARYDAIGEQHRRNANFFLADDVNEDNSDEVHPHLLPHQQPDRTERRPTRIQEMQRQREMLRRNREQNPVAAGMDQ